MRAFPKYSFIELMSFLVWSVNTWIIVPVINALWPLDVSVFYGKPYQIPIKYPSTIITRKT